MDDMSMNLGAMKLAERLQGARQEEFWVHLEAEGPLEKYPAKQHARRVRDRLDVTEGLIYLPGAPSRNNEDSDMPAPFRQRRYFYYVSGCDEANCHLAYDIKRDILTLFIPRVNPARVIWNGRGSTREEALQKYDIDEVIYVDQLKSWIHDWFVHYRYDGSQRLYVLRKEQIPSLRFPWPLDSTSLQPAINQCRMIKDDHEIKLIQKANDVSSKAHKQVLANITRFHNEAQVEGLFLNICVSNHAKQQAYDPIAASGPNAGTLHYDANNEDFGGRQLMCLDAGCEFDLYASDITRTFPLSGSWPTKEAENIYKLVERMQEDCIKRLAPGVRYLDLHILAHQIAIDGLLKLGILHNGTREEIYKAGTSKAFFPHGLGHHVGLEVHDVGQQELMSLYKHPKYEKVPSLYPEDFHLPVYDKDLCMAPTHPQSPHLEEGMVVTVEPGIYFSAYALKHFYLPSPVHSKYINQEVLHRYFPVGGVRIEDDILITAKAYKNLTTAPKGDAMFAIIKGINSTVKSEEEEKRRSKTKEEPLRRAPGISRYVAEPCSNRISRAATEPPITTRRAGSDDLTALQDHWLFRESKNPHPPPSPVKNSKTQQAKHHLSVNSDKERLPLCGSPSAATEHIFMGWQTENPRNGSSPYPNVGTRATVPKCQQCAVLSEAIGRLRKTLSRSTETSPNTSPNMGTGGFESRPLPETFNKTLPSSRPKAPEMRQITPFHSRSSVDKDLYERSISRSTSNTPLYNSNDVRMAYDKGSAMSYDERPSGPGYIPFGSQGVPKTVIRSSTFDTAQPLPQPKTQRRSVTFDGHPALRTQKPLNHGQITALTGGYSQSFDALANMHKSPSQKPAYVHSTEPHKAASGFAAPPPPPNGSFSNLSEHIHLPRLPQLDTYPTAILESGLSSGALAQHNLRTTLERNNQQAAPWRIVDPRPSLPNLRQGQASGVTERKTQDPTGGFLPAEPALPQNRHSTSIQPNNAYEQDLRRRRSMGSALKYPSDCHWAPQPFPHSQSSENKSSRPYPAAIPKAQTTAPEKAGRMRSTPSTYFWTGPQSIREDIHLDPVLRGLEQDTAGTVYGCSRPGGEELQGVDYYYPRGMVSHAGNRSALHLD